MPSHSSPNSLRYSTQYRKVQASGAVIDNTTVGATLQWIDSVTHGSNVKGYRELLRRGQNATTSLSGSRITVRVTPGNLTSRVSKSAPFDQGFTTMVDGSLELNPTVPGNPSSLDESEANARALGKFAEKIVSARSAIQGGVVLGELGQTLQMIRKPAQGLRKLVDVWRDAAAEIRAARRLGTASSLAAHKRAVAEHLADAWLEYSFGWKPLLSDVRDGCNALAIQHSGRSLVTKRITAVGTVETTANGSTGTHTYGYLKWNSKRTTVNRVQVIYRGAVRVKPIDPAQMDPALFGFSPEQFLPTAWELVPYSFLIDYFSNIGDIIYGWSSLLATLSWANKTTRKSIEGTYWSQTDETYVKTLSSFAQQWVSLIGNAPAKVVATRTDVVRAKYEGTTVPDLTLTMPSLGSQKWLNIAALIVSRNSDRSWSYD